jgi:hypothetical protein
MARASRRSRRISGEQYDNLVSAQEFAARLLQPVNHMLVVHWENALDGDADEAAVRHHDGRLRERIRKWLCRRNVVFHEIWTMERGEIADGLHVNHLFHLPSVPRSLRKAFVKKLADWTGIDAGVSNDPNVIGVAERRHPGESPIWKLKKFYGGERRFDVAFEYATKTRKRRHECLIRGKRCGTSQSLSLKARSKTGNNARQRAPDSPNVFSGGLGA